MANFTGKEVEYVTEKIMSGADLRDVLRIDFENDPWRVVGWLQNSNETPSYEYLGYEF